MLQDLREILPQGHHPRRSSARRTSSRGTARQRYYCLLTAPSSLVLLDCVLYEDLPKSERIYKFAEIGIFGTIVHKHQDHVRAH